VEFNEGYSLDSTGGTVATRDEIETSITSYVTTLRPGESVVLAKVSAAIVDVIGVHDVSGVTLTGVVPNAAPPPTTLTITPEDSGNIPIDPLQVPRVGAITLS
jgi:hypothetical protein